MSGPVVPENSTEVKPIENAGSFHAVNNQAGEVVTPTPEADIEARATLHKELETLGTTPPPSPDNLHAPIPEIKTEAAESPKVAEDSSWAKQINEDRKEKSKNAA